MGKRHWCDSCNDECERTLALLEACAEAIAHFDCYCHETTQPCAVCLATHAVYLTTGEEQPDKRQREALPNHHC